MENVRLGYCCINLSLADKKVTANRGMVKKTFAQKGPTYAGELAYLNLVDLLTILKWNVENDIYVYRMSSDIFPWMSEYEITQLANFDQIQEKLTEIGSFIISNGIRVSMHPGQFDVLCSPTPSVVEKTIIDLDKHSQIMDLMGLPGSHAFPINIHLGGSYGDKESATARFCENFEKLKPSTKSRLVVENDDKASQFSVKDLYEMVYMKIGTPITFDFHHHRFCDGGLTEEAAFRLAYSTWSPHRPLTHYSSCKRTFEDSSVIARSHAEFIYEVINTYGHNFDIEIEAKAKDLAVIKYRKDYINESLLERYLDFNDISMLAKNG
jgi:UV DNA damage endonuclease